MKNTIKATVALILCSATAFAAGEARQARPVACADYSIAKTDKGDVALCISAKGKPSVLRSFAIASLTDPSTGSTVKVAVGFR
jgi:hypothetical protein